MTGAGIGTHVPRISFGMIVLNGEPFVRYNLRSLYPWAHQIIVVEGACPTAAGVATPDGHSTDGTLGLLQRFQSEEDPERKLVLVTARDEGHADGFWSEKDEMSRAYARHATGDYLWQVDSDEFYHEEQMGWIVALLGRERPDAVSFPTLSFWGDVRYIANSFYLIRDNAREFHRLFAWGPGYTYKTHRPPTVLDAEGVDTRRKRWVRARDLERGGIYMYHYCLLFPHQVFNKVSYYEGRVNYPIGSWEESVYRRLEKPYRAHIVYQSIGWIERFAGGHPQQIAAMMGDIAAGRVPVETRDCRDVERLLSRRGYRIATRMLRMLATLLSRQPFYVVYRACAACAVRLRSLVRRNGTKRQGGKA
jgi:hypothetical protein